MNLVIAGDGETATHLARQLSSEHQDVVVIGIDKQRLAELDARFNVMTCIGKAVSPKALNRPGVPDCDLFISVTPWEEQNIIAAQLAKELGARRTVARIDTVEYVEQSMQTLFAHTGVDTMVFPELLATDEIEGGLKRNWARRWFELHDGEIIVAAVRLGEDTPFDTFDISRLGKIDFPFHVCAIKRNGYTIIPGGGDSLQRGDIVYFSILKDGSDKVMQLCGKENREISKVMISGAGKMGRLAASALSKKYTVKVIDADLRNCERMAEAAEDVTVVHADPRDIEVLREEGLAATDAFLALDEGSEKNIVSCMLARQAGVPVLVADIEDIQYFEESEHLEIDIVVNKKLLTSSTIFQLLLDTALKTPKCLSLEDAEVLEIIVGDTAHATRKPVRDLKLPRGMTIAGLVRDGVGLLVSGSTQIQAGDAVVVFCLAGSLSKVEKIFK